ncbi:MAG: DNA repair protein RecO [Alphaproteobacteria bacterium]|nr:DNA repair protein RecO [Alphaproteobacteria bacterium]
MQFSAQGYIVKIRNHGEKSAIVTLVCPQYGKIVGYVQGALSKRNLGIYQLGNFISFNAYARVEENMLSFKGVELVRSHTADFLLNNDKINALASLCRLIDECVAENDDLGRLYGAVDDFFANIHKENWLVYYSFFEYYLLDFLGIGLDTGKCAVTGKKIDLRYISPKTGRAVCAEVGEPYKDKLYAYPYYIIEKNYAPQNNEIVNVLTMTGNFLNKNFLAQHNLHLPEKRADLLNIAQAYKIKL